MQQFFSRHLKWVWTTLAGFVCYWEEIDSIVRYSNESCSDSYDKRLSWVMTFFYVWLSLWAFPVLLVVLIVFTQASSLLKALILFLVSKTAYIQSRVCGRIGLFEKTIISILTFQITTNVLLVLIIVITTRHVLIQMDRLLALVTLDIVETEWHARVGGHSVDFFHRLFSYSPFSFTRNDYLHSPVIFLAILKWFSQILHWYWTHGCRM